MDFQGKTFTRECPGPSRPRIPAARRWLPLGLALVLLGLRDARPQGEASPSTGEAPPARVLDDREILEEIQGLLESEASVDPDPTPGTPPRPAPPAPSASPPVREDSSAAASPPVVSTGEDLPLVARREVDIHFQLVERGAARLEGYRLYFTRDRGQTWELFDSEPARRSPVRFRAREDGRHGFKLVARDRLGTGEPAPQPGTPPDREVIIDTTAPRIQRLHPLDQSGVYSSLPMEIEWNVEDEHLPESPVDITYSIDGGPSLPVRLDAPARGQHSWMAPFRQGELTLVITAHDALGNVSRVVSKHGLTLFNEENEKPSHLLVKSRSNRRQVSVYYRLQDEQGEPLLPDQLRGVRLWYREGPGEWQDAGLDLDRNSPARFTAPRDGLFELHLSAEDLHGRSFPPELPVTLDRPPPPELAPLATVMVDTLEPRIQLLEPPPGAEIPAESTLTIRYRVFEANPLPATARVLFSLDGGESWHPIEAEIRVQAIPPEQSTHGELEFRLPSVETDHLHLALSQEDLVGNVGETTTLDRTPVRIRRQVDDPRERSLRSYQRALVLLSQPDADGKTRALEHFQAALREWEPSPAIHHDYAVALEWTSAPQAPSPDCLVHYRRALELAPDNLEIRFHLVAHLLRLTELKAIPQEEREEYLEEARAHFLGITWADLSTPPTDEVERRQREALRQQYLRWQETRFASPGSST